MRERKGEIKGELQIESERGREIDKQEAEKREDTGSYRERGEKARQKGVRGEEVDRHTGRWSKGS